MPRKKKPEETPLVFRSDIVFTENGVRTLSDPIPWVPATGQPNVNSTPAPAEKASPVPHQGDYTVKELAQLWHLSTDKIRELFRDEPGVVKLRDEHHYRKRKRPYVTLRIPLEVAARVKRRLS